MKQFLTLFCFPLVLFCCKESSNKKNVKKPPEENSIAMTETRTWGYNDTAAFPYDEYSDSGYFKGYIPEKIDSIEYFDSSLSHLFINSLLNKKEIILTDSQTLSHSVLIDTKTKIRYDTLKNSHTTIISQIGLGKVDFQKIYINGMLARNYRGTKNQEEDIFYLNESSFRSFTFKGKLFYYLGAYCSKGGSAALISYSMIYDTKNNILNSFYTFRVNTPLQFGDVNGDDNLDFLDIQNDGMWGVIENFKNPFSFSLYSDNGKGVFVPQKSKDGKPYTIEGNSGGNLWIIDTLNIEKINWPVKINFK